MDVPVSSVLLLAAAAVTVATLELPDFMKEKCRRNDPDLEKCMLRQANQVYPHIISGLPELRLLSLDPLYLEQILLQRERGTGPTRIQAIFNNCTVTGLANLTFKSIKMDVPERELKLEFHVPLLTLKGFYKVEGRIMLLPLTGSGPGQLTVDKANVSLSLHYDLVRKKGKEYAFFDKHIAVFPLSKMSIQLENLFNGHPSLGKQVNNFLNDNWREVVEDFTPTVGNIIGEVAIRIVNQFFRIVPFKELLP